MKQVTRIIALLIGISLISLFITRPALAFPPMPSSFYGTVKINDENVPDGTVIKAFINGKAYAKGKTQTYQGASVYSLDVPGDDTDSPAIDGGIDGDTIVFTVGGSVAKQTGTWKGSTNVNLNLSLTKDSSPEKSNPTKTQTTNAIVENTAVAPLTKAPFTPTTTVFVQAAPLPTAIVQSTPTLPEALVQPTLPMPTALVQPTLPLSTALVPSIPTITTAINSGNASAASRKYTNILGIVISVLILFVFLWFIFVHKPNK